MTGRQPPQGLPPAPPPYQQPPQGLPPTPPPYQQPPPSWVPHGAAPPGAAPSERPGGRRWKRWLGLLGLLAVVLAVVAGLAYLRYSPLVDDVRAVRESAQRFSAQARALEAADLDREAVASLRAGLSDLDERLGPIRDIIEDDPLVGVARGIPAIDTQIAAADALINASDALVEAGGLGLGLADRFVDLREANDADPDFAMMQGLVRLMVESSDDVDRIGELIDDANVQLAEISPEALRQIREARDLVAAPLDTYAPLLEQYRQADDVLPSLLGWGDEKRYLVLAQNPAELRPAGGYAGTIGVIGFKDGALTEQSFQDVYDLDLQRDLPFIDPPAELVNHLLGDEQSWRLADAAWSADFPTGAQKAREFFELEASDADIDGVIGITTFALDRLLEVVGPVTVEEYDVTVEPGDTTLTLLGVTRGTPTSVEGRKDILDDLARTLVQRLLALPADQWLPTVEALLDIGTQKMAVVWLEDEAAQELIREGGWDGAVGQGAGDYIYALEANMAPTSKYNLVVDRSASLIVKVSEEGDALDSLRLDWQNDAGNEGELYRSLRDFSNNQEGWYGAYLRLLVPQGSELVSANGEASDKIRGSDQLPDDAGRSVFGNYLFMPPGESTMSYLWTTPAAAVQTDAGWEYRLFVQKQPGARPQPWSIRIDLPDGAEVLELPDGAEADGNRVVFETMLTTDLELRVLYSLPDTAETAS